MSNQDAENGLVVQATDKPENLFEPLVPEAHMVLRRAMLSGGKVAVSTAQDVLDRAGVTKQQEGRPTQQIIISNSQVAILAKVAKEVEDVIEIEEGE